MYESKRPQLTETLLNQEEHQGIKNSRLHLVVPTCQQPKFPKYNIDQDPLIFKTTQQKNGSHPNFLVQSEDDQTASNSHYLASLQTSDNFQNDKFRTVNILERNSVILNKRETILGSYRYIFLQFGNSIQTSKYTWYNFLPKNLFIQFSKTANVFYLFIAFLQMVPLISITGGRPIMLLPLSMVILISMIKDIFEEQIYLEKQSMSIIEDSKRHKSDKLENQRKVDVYSQEQRQFIQTFWHKLKVGDIVRVQKNQYLPADLLILKTSEVHGTSCYVETKNLDGETNLKTKRASKQLQQLYSEMGSQITGRVYCEVPNDQIYNFEGTFDNHKLKASLNIDNLLLRGSSIRNTEWVEGVILYAGHDTKVMMNSQNSRYKLSTIERDTNRMVKNVFLIQTVLFLVACTYGTIWNFTNTYSYLDGVEIDPNDSQHNIFFFWVKTGSTWLLIFVNFIPISLLLTLELVKFFQGIFMEYEYRMFNIDTNQPAQVQACNLNEELGQVEFVFSDKTGTLTCNQMLFRRFSIPDRVFGSANLEDQKQLMQDEQLTQIFSQPESIDNLNYYIDYQNLMNLLRHLVLCHTVVIDPISGEYNASSPDELALIQGAKEMGALFVNKDHNPKQISQ